MKNYNDRHQAFIDEIRSGIKEFEANAATCDDMLADTGNDDLMAELNLMNERIMTPLMKAIEKRFAGARSFQQKIWIRATEGYTDHEEDLVASDEEVAFFRIAFDEIQLRGEQLDNYTEMELREIQAIGFSAFFLKKNELIAEAGLSEGFFDAIENKLENEGICFM